MKCILYKSYVLQYWYIIVLKKLNEIHDNMFTQKGIVLVFKEKGFTTRIFGHQACIVMKSSIYCTDQLMFILMAMYKVIHRGIKDLYSRYSIKNYYCFPQLPQH